MAFITDKEKKTSKTGNHANDLNGQWQRRDNNYMTVDHIITKGIIRSGTKVLTSQGCNISSFGKSLHCESSLLPPLLTVTAQLSAVGCLYGLHQLPVLGVFFCLLGLSERT